MEKIRAFFRETNDELFHKVSWPSWEELQSSTIVVMVASILIAIVIYIIDLAASGALGFFYSLFAE
jgi:preprotein translocase subunit SecE